MAFNSGKFLIFFPLAVILYLVLPRRLKNFWLLACSYYFYMSWNPVFVLLLIFSTLVTYASGILLDRFDKNEALKRWRKTVVAASIIINTGLLIYFKYTGFLISLADRLLAGIMHGSMAAKGMIPQIILPVGISFFTFQALGYTIDVYRGSTEAEYNIIKYALFVSFFPQLVAGPIERSGNLLVQIKKIDKERLWDYESIVRGLILMVWGFFMKVVLADRLSSIVDVVFDDQYSYGASLRIFAAAAFSIQLYCDFAGYSMIAIGAAKVMGIRLMENFNTPFFARNIKDFWNRWHISLSTWFRDYLYFPMGGSRCSKRKNYFNLMVTFLVSGLWHGAALKYVIWGGLNGVFQVFNRIFSPIRKAVLKKVHIREDGPVRYLETAVNFMIVTLTLVVFRANSVRLAFEYLIHIISRPDYKLFVSDRMYRLLVSDRDLIIDILAILILFIVSFIRKKKDMMLDEYLMGKSYPVRATVMLILLFFIILFGHYGEDVYTQPFVYFQF